jgi:menaquinol-cytochrome c reductase iron-sulfur subunit
VLSPPGGIGSGGRYVKTVRLESLKDGEPKKVVLIADRRDAWMIEKDAELGAVWLLRKADSVLAFSVVCPHLGCSIGTEAGGKFACPCHDSSFTPEGKKLSGPSPRDLDRLETKIEDGFVHVEFRKFRYGIPERVEIG